MINWTYTQTMPKGMSVNHIIERMQIPLDQKEKLKSNKLDDEINKIFIQFLLNSLLIERILLYFSR